MMKRTLLATTFALSCAAVWAQPTGAASVQRDVNQQTRIEAGLKDGSLSTQEAAKLEREESRVDRLQSRSMKDGQLSDAERARLNAAQNKVSADIAAQRHDAQTGNPNSASSQRMQADVGRNINQEKRIENGLQSGALTTREAGRLEAGQARVNHLEARAGSDGHVGAAEQARLQKAENRQSRHIYRQKHDAQTQAH